MKSRPRSKDPLTAAITSYFLPGVKQFNFIRKSNRLIVRITDDLLQFFDFQLSSYGGKRFCVNYANISLFYPREHLILQPGERIRDKRNYDIWRSAKTHAQADESMKEILYYTNEFAIPWFEDSSTVKSYYRLLQNESWGAMHHLELERGCCCAKLGFFQNAIGHLKNAINLYQEDGREWCAEYIYNSETLISAIESKDTLKLLDKWTNQSINNLNLNSIIKRCSTKENNI